MKWQADGRKQIATGSIGKYEIVPGGGTWSLYLTRDGKRKNLGSTNSEKIVKDWAHTYDAYRSSRSKGA